MEKLGTVAFSIFGLGLMFFGYNQKDGTFAIAGAILLAAVLLEKSDK
jgi:hypothetical protein